jgi:HlyD family secretion protein
MKRFFIPLIICLLVIAVILTFLFYRRHEKNSRELVLYGNVDVRQVDIGFRVPGQVAELYFEEGDSVCAGELMAKLDRTPYDQEVRKAVADLHAAEANLQNAEILFKRRKELVRVGGVSEEDVDNAGASRDEARAQVQALKAALTIADERLGYTEAIAPTDGIILTRIREPGTVVREADPVFTLSVSSPVWIRAFVSEPQLGNVSYGMCAEIYTDTPGAPVYTGKVGFISPVAEFTPKTVQTTELRTDLVYRLRIYVDNPDHLLKQGMPVTVKFKYPLERKKGG